MHKNTETTNILSKLKELDIRIWIENNTIKYDAPRGVLTTEILNLLKENKKCGQLIKKGRKRKSDESFR